MSERRFPLILDRREERLGVMPKSVPWELVAGHERQALANHFQSLERLAQRGGLSPMELWCVVHDRGWDERAPYETVAEWLFLIRREDK